MTTLGQATSRQTAVRLSLQRIAAICSEIWLLFSLFCGVFLVISLSTFTATDPGWSNASSNTSSLLGNSGGTIGAWCADVILNLVGYPGYLSPLVLVCGCWYLGRFRFTTLYYADMGLRLTGILLLLLGSCALAEVYYAHRDILPVGSGGGGVVGSFLADMLLEPVGVTGFSLLMLMALVSGIALAFNISWLNVATRLGTFLCLVGDRLRQQMVLGGKVCMSWLRDKLDSLRQNRAAAKANRQREALETGSFQTVRDGGESAFKSLTQASPLVAAHGSSAALSSLEHDDGNEPSIPSVATMKSEGSQGQTGVNPFADQKVSQNFGMADVDGVDAGAASGQDQPELEPEESPVPRSDETGRRRQGIPLPGCADDGVGYELPQHQKAADMQLAEDMTLPPVAAGENLPNDSQAEAAYYYGAEKSGGLEEDAQILPEGVGTEWHMPMDELPVMDTPVPDDSIVPEGAATEPDWSGEPESECGDSIQALPSISMLSPDDTILPVGIEVAPDSDVVSASSLPVIPVPSSEDTILPVGVEVAPDNNVVSASSLPVIPVPSPEDIILPVGVEVAPDNNVVPASSLPVIAVPSSEDTILPVDVEVVKVAPDNNVVSASSLPVIAVPSLTLLSEAEAGKSGFDQETMQSMAQMVEQQLGDFGVQCKVVGVIPGPVITCFELELAPGIKGSRVTNLARDLARALSVVSVRVVEIIPGKSVLGLEVPNANRETVNLREILDNKAFSQSDYALPIALGKDIGGEPTVVGLDKMPHLLVAGTTGSGKSVALNAMILSILYRATAQQVRMIMIDPKMLELSVYQDIPHLLAPVVTDMKEASNALQWCVAEMERRYHVLAAAGVRNISGYHSKQKESDEDSPNMPYIVVVIDELADMMMVTGKKVEEQIARLAQKARAAGIHLILATQRPSVDVITGLIKANIPSRVSFQVSSRIDSRTILDQMGAESLLGHGDMLYMPVGAPIPARLHGAFVDDGEVHRVADWLREASGGVTDYIEDIVREAEEEGANVNAAGKVASNDEDPLYEEARLVVVESRRPTISYVQRRMRIGYNRAARLLEEMEARGVVSAPEGSGNREILQPQAPTAI